MLDRAAPARARTQPKLVSRGVPAPSRGWIRNDSIAKPVPGGAEVLENIFPTPEGARLFKGSAKHATIAAEVTHLAAYETGSTDALFGFDATTITDITSPASATVAETPAIQQLTSGDFSTEQMTTSGGSFMFAANGADLMHQFDGTNWYPINGNSTSGLAYDAGSAAFTVGQTVTGGTSGATATIVGVLDGTTAAGTLLVQSISGGPFQDNEALTDGATGSATANIPSGVSSINTGTISGITTSDISHVWRHGSRIWFIKKDTLEAYYLPVDSIAGTATLFNLRGVFSGGSLLFGATWSTDSGDGKDDLIVFVSDEGECAIYSGTDPASNFDKQGVYKLGRPLGKNAHFRAGGDLAIVTDDGIVPVGSAIQQDRAALAGSAITYPIEDEWRRVVADRVGSSNIYSATLWHRETMLVIGVPTVAGVAGFGLVANARTGAWTKRTGWDIRCSVVYGDQLYFGDSNGAIFQGETTGADDGASYSGLWVPRFNTWGDPNHKAANHARLIARSNKSWEPQLFAAGDYFVEPPTPLASPDNDGSGVWDTAVWDSDVWDEGASPYKRPIKLWQTVAAQGVALAPGLEISSGRSQEPDIEFISMEITYQPGNLLG